MDLPVKKKKKHSLLKWFVAIFGTIIIIAIGVAWYINKQWKPLLTQTIQNTVIDATDSLYKVDFVDIQVNILTGNVTIDSITLKPDLKIYQKLINKRIASENLLSLKIAKLSLKNVTPLKVYFDKKLDIKSIVIQNPELTIYYSKLKNQIEKPEDNRTPYERIKNVLKQLKIASILLNDVKFKYVDQSFKKPVTTAFDQVNIRLNDIQIDSLSQTDTARIFSTKDIIAEINNYSFATADSMYHINIKHAYVSSLKKQLELSGVELAPRYKEMAFSEQFKLQQERYKLAFDSVCVKNIDFNRLIAGRTVHASNISLFDGKLDVFLNRAKPLKRIDKGKNFPHLSLRRVPWTIIADTVVIKSTNISYSEYNAKTDGRGTLFLNNLNGRIFNVTNDSLMLTKNHTANAYVQTYVMGKGKLDVHIGFNLMDPKGAFTANGSLGPMFTSSFNSLTKPLAMVATSSGKINSMNFKMYGNVNGAKGEMTLRYQDLNVALMKKDEKDNFKKLGLISLIANALLVHNSNPKGKDPLIVAHPYYVRPPEGSFFNLIWKTIFEGLKESIGISKEKQAKLEKRARSFKEAKENREKRKKERLKKRELRKIKNDKDE